MNLHRKDTPAPFARSAQSPPRTPPRTGSKRTSKVHKSPRDIYFEGLTDDARGADGDDTTPKDRISHDLSLTANIGRSSVVDNMLLSLNPDQPKFGSPPYSSRFTSSESPRSRGHLPSSSLTSDYSFPSPSSEHRPDSHRSTHHPRGRRSNSSNFQSLSRIDSLTTDDEKSDNRRTRTYQSQRAGLGGRAALPPSRSGRKSSKSSGSSSVDFGQMMRQSTVARRSASFDDGRKRPSFPLSTTMSQPIIYNSIEAAPTPTVPSGPRSPARIPPTLPQPASSSSKRSFRNPATKKSKSSGLKPTASQDTERLQDARHPSLSASQEARPASPVKGRDDILNAQQKPPSQSRDHMKERPGFFRRVFMSSRNTNATTNDDLTPFQSSRNSVRANSRAIPAASNVVKTGQSAETSQSRGTMSQPLAKKPSSFFRRRKKSISENVFAPDPVHIQHPDLRPPDPIMKHNPSMSSLRELMNPYLSSSVESRKGSTFSQADNKLKSGSILVEKSTVKPVFPQTATHNTNNKPLSRGRQVEEPTSQHAASARADAFPDDKFLQAHEQSFLRDDSSNETRPTPSKPPAHDSTEPPTTETTEIPQGSQVMPNELQHSSGDQKAPFNDGSIQPAQPLADYMQNSARKKPRAMKSSRPRAASEETFSMTENESPAPIEAAPIQETVVAAVTNDETNPRVWLRPERSTEDLRKLAESSSSTANTEQPQASDRRPASSRKPPALISIKTAPETAATSACDPRSPDFDVTLPFREDRVLAQRVFEGDEALVSKAKAAAWLGEAGPDRARTRRAYMELFDWQNLNILAALRDFCGRLLLKGETQQVDRILDAFSTRWCECNPNHGFKATGAKPSQIRTFDLSDKLTASRCCAHNMLLDSATQH